jgi:hypothetical protein
MNEATRSVLEGLSDESDSVGLCSQRTIARKPAIVGERTVRVGNDYSNLSRGQVLCGLATWVTNENAREHFGRD